MLVLSILPVAARRVAGEEPSGIRITRAAGPIVVDGDLSDPGWQGATRVDTWYETNPGDNVAPKVKNVAYLAYDDKFLYAAFEFFDPDPSKIRAPFGDRDNVPSSTDYGGVILDTRNDGRTGLLLLANPRGIQYDAITGRRDGPRTARPTSSGTRRRRSTKDGWVLEIRIPFSSLRYAERRPADLGHPALPQLPARLPLPDVLLEAAARRQLLHLPLATADRPRGPAARRAPRRRALRHGEGGRASRAETSAPRSRTSRSGGTGASTSSGRPTRTPRSTRP